MLPPVPKLAVPVLGIKEALAKGRAHRADVKAMWAASGPDDLALLQYTGGTTGVAKGAMLTHGNILTNLDQVRAVSAASWPARTRC